MRGYAYLIGTWPDGVYEGVYVGSISDKVLLWNPVMVTRDTVPPPRFILKKDIAWAIKVMKPTLMTTGDDYDNEIKKVLDPEALERVPTHL